ncbi:hypothetical protein [Streptomyces sp. CEV 2-1]|nr:hypothetical protein [Streptomyces sp. CEV 2-1]
MSSPFTVIWDNGRRELLEELARWRTARCGASSVRALLWPPPAPPTP